MTARTTHSSFPSCAWCFSNIRSNCRWPSTCRRSGARLWMKSSPSSQRATSSRPSSSSRSTRAWSSTRPLCAYPVFSPWRLIVSLLPPTSPFHPPPPPPIFVPTPFSVCFSSVTPPLSNIPLPFAWKRYILLQFRVYGQIQCPSTSFSSPLFSSFAHPPFPLSHFKPCIRLTAWGCTRLPLLHSPFPLNLSCCSPAATPPTPHSSFLGLFGPSVYLLSPPTLSP